MADEIIINDPFHGFEIAQEAGVVFNPKADQVVARVLDNELLGGVVYTAFNPGGSIAMHMAGFNKRWVSQDLVWMCFDYPFNQLKVKKVFAPVPSNNTKAIAINRRLGFLREYIIPDVFDDCDLYLMDMYRDECKWLKITPKGYIGGNDGRQGESTSTT
jgi:RimJ/RimL family protein N-acetyltransferase